MALLAVPLLTCSHDATCVFYPCPLPLAVVASVSAANAPAGIPGLVLTVSGTFTESAPCSQAPVSTCQVYGGTGTYHVQVSAPGYATAQLDLTVTGTDAGCNTCGHVDTQRPSITMQPTP